MDVSNGCTTYQTGYSKNFPFLYIDVLRCWNTLVVDSTEIGVQTMKVACV